RLIGPRGPIKIGNKAFKVLLLLAEQNGRLLTKDALFSSVWDGTIVSESSLTSVIKELRRALGDESRTPRYIESVYGRGYRFIAPVAKAERKDALPPVPQNPPRPPAERQSRPSLGEPPLLYFPRPEDEAVRDGHPYLAETLREEILFTLARFREIRLVSDTSRATTGGQPSYGDRDYQLSLRLLGRGDILRAFARLSRLSSGAIIWAEAADLVVADIGGQADQLVRRIAAAALPTLQDDVLRNLPEQPSDGYSLYFQNKLQMRCENSLDGARALADSWERLIALHPTLSGAYPPLIRLYNTDYCFTGFGSCGRQERARAYELAHRAIALDSTEAHLHSVKAWCHLWAGEAALARSHFEEALRLNPYNQTRLIEASTGFMFLDDLERATLLLERSRNLAPFPIDAPHEEQALLHLLREEFDLAGGELALVRRGHPDDGMTTEPTVLSELYALLAAAGAGAGDLPQRSRRWQQRMRALWVGDDPPNAEGLTRWAVYHNPFQSASRREWMLSLLRSALSAAPPD
ncbi:MAG: winged helix-turn-helix domain-containing protein, partial [Pseudomonadota bacterium]|nr:winged helix-turn-helix domain-containing protein [Pseudomonadota bacterium]